MFVEATTRKALKEAGLKIRIVERAGRSLKKILTKPDPFREDKNCKVCKLNSSANRKGREVVYQVKWQGFTGRSVKYGLYIRETARSIGARISEHLNKYEVKGKAQFFTNTLKRSIDVKDKRWN